MALESIPTGQNDNFSELTPASPPLTTEVFTDLEFEAAKRSVERGPANYRLVRDFVDELPRTQDGVFPVQDKATAKQLQRNLLWVPQTVEDMWVSREIKMPYYVVGQRDGAGKQTQLLLAQPRHEGDAKPYQSPDSRRLHIATVLAKQWQVVQRLGEASSYEQRTREQWEEKYVNGELVVSERDAVMRTLHPSIDLPWIGRKSQDALRKGMAVEMRLLNNSLNAEDLLAETDFDGFGVMTHLGWLASAFGKTVELQELEQTYGI